MKSLRIVLFTLLTLVACAKLDAPTPGHYRAVLTLPSGEAPLPLQISGNAQQLQVALVNGDELLGATQIRVHEGQLAATLPNGAGELQARFRSRSLDGEWRLKDAQGKQITFPFTAQLDAHYRFVEQSATDNADVSGEWQFNLENSRQPASTLQLTQTHDAIDGSLSVEDRSPRMAFGQVHGETVYLSIIGDGEVWRVQGRVDAQGNLQGESWINANAAQRWSAQRSEASSPVSTITEPDSDRTRQVAFPWAIPNQ